MSGSARVVWPTPISLASMRALQCVAFAGFPGTGSEFLRGFAVDVTCAPFRSANGPAYESAEMLPSIFRSNQALTGREARRVGTDIPDRAAMASTDALNHAVIPQNLTARRVAS